MLSLYSQHFNTLEPLAIVLATMDARIKNFGGRVRHFRKRLRLSQDEFAEKANLHRTYIGAVERGERNISLLNILRLADALGVRVKDLLDDDLKIKDE